MTKIQDTVDQLTLLVHDRNPTYNVIVRNNQQRDAVLKKASKKQTCAFPKLEAEEELARDETLEKKLVEVKKKVEQDTQTASAGSSVKAKNGAGKAKPPTTVVIENKADLDESNSGQDSKQLSQATIESGAQHNTSLLDMWTAA